MKQLLLYLSFTLFVFNISFSQVPANDLIENAIEIDPSNYNEENLRLDLATASGISPSECATGGIPVVYYKFTAVNTGSVSAVLSDMINDPIDQALVVFYTATDLNQTDESQINIASTCQFGESATLEVTTGQSYYLQVYRNDANALSEISITFAQAPANGDVTTATLITGFPFADTNVRLDLASADAGGQIGCGITSFPTVYYKYTATETINVVSTISDPTNQGLGNILMLFYQAPDLNVTSNNQLFSVSTCNYSTSTDIVLSQGTSYYIAVSRTGGGSNLSDINFVDIPPPAPVPTSERDALTALYNATNGDNWYNEHSNWNTDVSVSLWSGITTQETDGVSHVTQINLAFRNLIGTIPDDVLNLPYLNWFVVYENDLSGNIPDFTTLSSLIVLDFEANNFEFGDFENEFASYTTLTGYFDYFNQGLVEEETGQAIDIGNSTTLTTNISGSQNNYQWYKDGVLLSGETNTSLNVTVNTAADYGTYYYTATSDIVTGLTLQRHNISINESPLSHPDYDALVAFYNATNGATLWNNNTNWLDPNQPVSTWFGITEVNGRVTEINLPANNLVFNEFPIELTTLTELTRLNIFNDPQIYAASGSIPPEIENLTNLEYLDIRSLGLSGEIPSELGNIPNLNWIDIRYNTFTGQIPQELTNLSNLSIFVASGNNFTGVVPDFSGNSNLTFLWIENNAFHFAGFENQFVAYQTNMGGNFVYSPQSLVDEAYSEAVSIGNSTTLNTSVSGSQNNYQWYKDGVLLSGETNSSLNITINTTADYGIYNYQATSTIVTGLTLQSRDFTIGEDPSENPDYAALVALYNSTNGSTWTTNTNWVDNTKPLSTWHGITLTNGRVTRIVLGSNNLTGTLPTTIGDFTELQHLLLYANQITGTIPPEIGDLSNLIELDLSPNTFTGPIPTEIGNLTNLEILWLNQNGLTGSIPQSFQNLTSLTQLHLIGSAGPPYSSSAFSGDFPDLTGLPLSTLDMRYNYFTFNDIADEFATYQANIQFFDFSPQYTLDVPEDVAANAGSNIVLTLTDVAGTNRAGSANRLVPNTYQWHKDNVAITGSDANSYTIVNAQPSDSGVYHCVITNIEVPDMEIFRAPITVAVGTLNIDDNTLLNFNIYPNPTTGIINIKQQSATKIKVSVFDIRGRLIITQDFESKVSQLDMSNIQNGMYVLQIQSEGKQITKRIIKQ